MGLQILYRRWPESSSDLACSRLAQGLWFWSRGQLLRERDHAKIQVNWLHYRVFGDCSKFESLWVIRVMAQAFANCFVTFFNVFCSHFCSPGNTTRCWTTSPRSCPPWWLPNFLCCNIGLASWVIAWADMAHWWLHCWAAQIVVSLPYE